MADDVENACAGPKNKRQDNTARILKRFYLIATAIVAADQITKWAVIQFIGPDNDIPVLGPIMSFALRHNTGAAWGIFSAHTEWLIALAAVMVIAIAALATRLAAAPPIITNSLAIMLGGAMGNLIDRVRLGYVVDFIDFHVWPVFNVADIAIVACAVAVCYHIIRDEFDTKHTPKDKCTIGDTSTRSDE